MPQHLIHRHIPLVLETRRQLLHLCLRRYRSPPHVRLGRLDGRVRSYQAVVTHLHETQPGHVPAAVAVGVGPHARVGVVHNVGADGVVACEAAQLDEELVRGNVVHPGRRHRFLEGAGFFFVFAGGGYAFDAAELGEGVDAVVGEGFDEGPD